MKKYITHIIVVLPWLVAMIFINRAPEILVTHYDVYGNATTFMRKEWVVLSMAALTLLAHIIIQFVIKKYPKQFGINSLNAKMYKWMMPAGSTFLMWCLIGKYLI